MNYWQISSKSTQLKADVIDNFAIWLKKFFQRSLKKIEECHMIGHILSFSKIYYLLDSHYRFLIYDVFASMQLDVN